MTLPELLVAVLVLGLMAAVGMGGVGRALARTRVEAATRQLAVDLEQARGSAEASGIACALELTPQGWAQAPASDLPACRVDAAGGVPQVQLSHNLAGPLRIASNGLVLDGGTVVVAAPGSDLQRCLVVSLPLGVVRTGRSQAAPGAPPRSSDCVVDPSL
jgi:type II secretory pathway pseudopilin PulG